MRLIVTALPPRELINGISGQLNTSPNNMDAIFGHQATQSDYNFVKTLYEFTPDAMHHWSISSRTFGREATLLILKSLAPASSARSGIFKVQNQGFEGFQQGNTQARENGIVVNLYSDGGSIELIFTKQNNLASAEVTQPEINRVIQSLHKTM